MFPIEVAFFIGASPETNSEDLKIKCQVLRDRECQCFPL